MRLLKFDSRGELSLTKNLIEDIPSYAILSHTWGADDDDEVTFDDIKNGSGKSKVSGYAKIQFCGKQAWRDGLQYFWVDTCCIDKASHAELSQAIASMFRWYRNAARCYVYLADVSARKYYNSQADRTWESAFRKSRWFTRGWTLQELLAPKLVEFYSLEGQRLGDRNTLEQEVYEITEIPLTALRGTPPSQFSVDERLRWAAKRETKMKEDKAYCLMGIFEVFLPLIYGEEENAFIRLREEIDKRLSSKLDLDKLPYAEQHRSAQIWAVSQNTCTDHCECSCHRRSIQKNSERRIRSSIATIAGPTGPLDINNQCSVPDCGATKRRPRQRSYSLPLRNLHRALTVSILLQGLKFRLYLRIPIYVPEYSELYTYTREGDLENLKRFFRAHPAATNVANVTRPDGWTPLHTAAYSGRYTVARFFMWAGADQNAIEIQNRKASHLAVAKSVKMTATQEERALVDLFGPNTRKDFKEHFRLTPVHESIIRLRHDPNIDTPDLSELLDLVSQANRAPENQDWSRWKATLSNHASPLWEVLDLFHKSAVKLQASGPQNRRPSYDLMNQPDFNGWTPLHWAAYSGRLKETRILLEKGACANQLTSSNRNLLHHVAESGNDELMGAVLQHDCRPTMYLDQQDLWGETPLHIAATRSLGCVRLLLDHGANTRLLQSERQTPLHWASQAGETQRLAITDLLSIRDPSLVNVKDEAGRTPIFLFLAMPDCVRLLLARGAITDIRDHLKRNLLHDACAGNHYEALKALLPRCHTQSIHQKDSRGIKPLEEAFERSSVDCIIILLERKDIHFDLKMGKKGWNLLHYAVHLGDAQVVELVLDGRFKLSDLISNTPQGQSVEQLAGSNLKHESRDEVLNLLNRLKK